MSSNKKLIYQEKYRKGTFINERKILKLLTDNINKVSIEIRQKTISTDKGESLLIEIHFNNAKLCGEKVEQA